MNKAWPMVPLGEVMKLDVDRVAVDPTKTYEMVGVYSFGRGLFRREPVFGGQTSYNFFYRLKAEHVVMSQLFGWEGALALSSEEFAGLYVSPQFPTFFCDSSRLDRQFLGWFMRRSSFWKDLGMRAKGMGDRRRTLNPEALLSSIIPLPLLSEQRRIVARIEELAAKIEEARGVRGRASQEMNVLLDSALRAFFKHAESNRIEFKNIGSFTTYERYGPRFYNELYSEDGIPIMRATDIDEAGRVDYRFMPKMSVSLEEKEKLTLRSGDLVVVRSGSVGLSAVFDRTDLTCIPAAYLIQFRFDESVSPYYVRYCLQCPLVQDDLKGRGTALKNVNSSKIKSVQIPVFPLPEQRRIVAYLDDLQAKVDALKCLQAETAGELDALLPSVLDRAFKGEL